MTTDVAAAEWNFGKRLKELRDQGRGLSQRELGRRMGVKHPAIAQWEQMSRAPKQETLEKLAKALECSIADLFPGGNADSSRPDSWVLSERLAARETEIRVLSERLAARETEIRAVNERLIEVRQERDRLRQVIVEYCAAAQDKADQARRRRASQRLQQEALRIPQVEAMEAVESIGQPDTEQR